MVLIGTTHHHFLSAKCRHVDVSIHHLAFMVTGDAVKTDDVDITIYLGYPHNDALPDKKLMNTAGVLHRHLFTIATLPETPFAVLEHLVVIPVTGSRRIAVRHFLQRIAGQGIHTPTRGSCQEFATLSLQNRCYTRRLMIRERVMHKAVRHIVVPRKSQSRANPQMSFAVAVELRDNITGQRRRLIRLRQVGRKTVAIIFVQTVFCRYPYIAVLVLTNIIDETT